jgi:hypothetical protein
MKSHGTPRTLFAAAVLALVASVAGRAPGIGQTATPAAVHALFDVARPGGAPFPTDLYTVADETTNFSFHPPVRSTSMTRRPAASPVPAGLTRIMAPAQHNAMASAPRMLDAYGKLPLSFEVNRGQVDRGVQFLAHGRGYTVWLTATEAVLALQTPANVNMPPMAQGHARSRPEVGALPRGPAAMGDPEARRKRHAAREAAAPAVVHMRLVGATATAPVTGEQRLPGTSNYFIGTDPHQWHTRVPTYAQVRYEHAYPGIDLVYYGRAGQLEYDFVVAPGTSPTTITLSLTATGSETPLRLDADGNLIVGLAETHSEISFHKPVVYQPAGTGRTYLEGRYTLKGPHEVGFDIPAADPSKPVVIDPTLSYSTYLGGSNYDIGHGIAVDRAGNAYVTGYTQSTDFPTANPFQATIHGGSDAFVAALDPSGSTLLYSTYLGGSGNESGAGIAVDGAGNAYVTGDTTSTDFPTANPFQPTNHGRTNAFVAALDPTGSTLLYSTYLGGSDIDSGLGIAVDRAGNAYVTGGARSTNFPTANPLQPTNHGAWDAFVAALDPSGSTLLYSTYLGGSIDDFGYGIAVDNAGNAYVTGITGSANFPTANPFQPTYGGSADAFVAALDPTGSTLLYSTYLGGSGTDVGYGIAVDGAGNAYVTGGTASTDFPTANPFQPTNQGGADAFVAALDPSGSTLLYSTYLGGSIDDVGNGIAVDNAGNAYVTGYTGSANFPTANPFQATIHGGSNAFVAALDATGSTLLYSTYLGGSGTDGGHGIAVDSAGNAYVTGETYSTNFPTANPFQPTNHATSHGAPNAFVTKIAR